MEPPVVYEIARDPDTVADQAQLLAGGPERQGVGDREQGAGKEALREG